MKKLLIVAFLFGSAFSVCAQMTLSSTSNIVVASGSHLVVNDVVNTSGTITNNGTVDIKGDITNNGGGLFASTSSGTTTFNGSSGQVVSGTATVHYYGTVNINNASGVAFTDAATGANQEIHGTLSFTSGKLTLNGFDLTIGSTDPTGTGTNAYIVTNGTGQLVRSVPADGSTTVTFPVGNSAFNPMMLQNSATATTDTYGVKVTDSKPSSFSGTTHIVDRSWDITETTPGGSDLTMTTQWNSGEELTDFTRSKSCFGVTTDNGSNVEWGPIGAANGSDPYTYSSAGSTSVGTYMIGDYYYGGIVVDLKAFLAAAYNSTNDNMDKTLNTAGLLPTTDPYSLGTTVSNVPSNAVDWVKIQLRDPSNSATVLYSFARFVNQDGQIIEENGDNFKMTGVPMGSYYIAILHRNHLGIMSASTVNLDSSPTLSFTTAQTTAYQSGASNAAMKEVETGVFGLWDGDANSDGQISYNGAGSDRLSVLNALLAVPGAVLSSVYNINDVNMDGNVNYNGAGNDRISILNVLQAVPGGTYNEHLPQ